MSVKDIGSKTLHDIRDKANNFSEMLLKTTQVSDGRPVASPVVGVQAALSLARSRVDVKRSGRFRWGHYQKTGHSIT